MRAQDAAPAALLVEDGHLVALLGQIERAGEAGRARAHHRDALALRRYDVATPACGPSRSADRPPRCRAGRWLRRPSTVRWQRSRQGCSQSTLTMPGKTVASRSTLYAATHLPLPALSRKRADVHVERAREGAGGRLPAKAPGGVCGGVLRLHGAPGAHCPCMRTFATGSLSSAYSGLALIISSSSSKSVPR